MFAFAVEGIFNSIPPLTQPSLTPDSATLVSSTSTPPLVVLASIGPEMSTALMPPFVASAVTRPFSPLTCTPPLTVENLASAEAGTLTV